MRRCLTLIFSCAFMFACAAASADEIRVEGGGAAVHAVFIPMKELFEKSTGHKLIVTVTTPIKGLIALEKGKADVATAAVGLTDLIKGAAREGVIIDPATLDYKIIAEEHTVVMLHKSNRVRSLSKEQLKGIFTGKIRNWKEVGGVDSEIVVVWGKDTPGQNAQFSEIILDNAPLTPNAKPATDYVGIRDVVIQTVGSIGIDPHGISNVQVTIPETPRLVRPILVITKGKPSVAQKQLFDFYRDEFAFLSN